MDATEAAAESAQATADESESQALKNRAQVFEGEAEALQVSAADDEEGSKALGIKAGEEQTSAEMAAVQAAADEAAADEEDAVAGEATVAAARFESEELSDGAAVVVCEFLPLLDVVCDVVGGIAEVSLATAAAAEVAQAVAATSAAVAARDNERIAVTKAAESEAGAASDGEAAVVLESKAELEEADALADHEEAERDEVESIALHSKSEEEEVLANEKRVNAETEEVGADASLQNAVQHGLFAAQQAILSSATGVLALSYFAIKFLIRAVGGSTRLVATAFASCDRSNSSRRRNWLQSKFLRDMSYTVVHLLVFVSTLALALSHPEVAHVLDGSALCTIRSKGGWLLIFGLTAATAHCSMLHVMPSITRRLYPVWEWVGLFGFMLVLFILEALILLVALRGSSIGSRALLCIQQIPLWLIWFCLVVCAVVHCCVLREVGVIEEPLAMDDEEIADCCKDERCLDETASLLGSLPTDLSRNKSKKTTSPNYLWRHLLIPFEALLLFCMVPIILSCFSHATLLWPLVRHLIAGFEWVIPGIALAYLILLGVVVWWSAH